MFIDGFKVSFQVNQEPYLLIIPIFDVVLNKDICFS